MFETAMFLGLGLIAAFMILFVGALKYFKSPPKQDEDTFYR